MDVIKQMRKAFLIGLGTASLTKKKAEVFVDDLKKRGIINPTQGEKMVKALLNRAEKEGKLAKKRLEKAMGSAIKGKKKRR